MSRKKNGFAIYKTYSFSGQDPAVRDVLTAVSDDKHASESSEVSRTTIRNWRSRKTRRPQFATMQAVAIACGKRFVLEDDK